MDQKDPCWARVRVLTGALMDAICTCAYLLPSQRDVWEGRYHAEECPYKSTIARINAEAPLRGAPGA